MTGRPSDYSEALANVICGRIADGESLKSICADEAMPCRTAVYEWLSAHPAFADKYARAREDQADTLAEEIVGIADEECTTVRADKHRSADDDGEGNTEVVFDSAAVARNRLRVDARKWVAAKLKPRKYGDKLELEHSGSIAQQTDEQLDARLAQLLGKAGAGVVARGTGEAQAADEAAGVPPVPETG